MIKNISLMVVAALFSTSFLLSQNIIDSQNTREGESVEYCREHKQLLELLKNPEFKKQWDKDQMTLATEENFAKSKLNVSAKGILYRIPVVFHVLHNNGVENISKDQIDDALFILNRDFRRLNSDANNVYAPFSGTAADIEIEFVYATIAPNGQCFNGITRTVSSFTSEGDDGVDQMNAIIAGNDIYNGQWPGNKYLNIFICKEIGGAAGYTYRPNNFIGSNMRNGIWVLQNYVGSIGTGTENRSRTLTHEVGHWLNLPHVWGGTNNPGLASNCDIGPNDDDGVDDTPECIGNTTCQLNANTCSLDNGYWGFDQVDPVENYMNYSYCSKMFSEGQAIKMRAALNSTVGGRNNISTSGNLAATGADSNLFICQANFTSSTEYVCPGKGIKFYDKSFNNIKGWSWSFPGGTPSTSTVKNPVVTYDTPGTYSVTLIATDSITNLTTSKTNYIKVMPEGISLPYSESFENYTSLSNSTSFWRPTGSGNTAFGVTNTAGSEGSKSIKLRNFVNGADTYSELYSNPFDLSSIPAMTPVTFSFKYAHRRKNASDYEIFRFHASNDCGETWSVRKTLLFNSLSTDVVGSDWTPSINDWVQVHVININSVFFVNGTQFKFSFESDGGNNLFIDEINLYQGGPESLSLNELGELENIQLYPNPADEELNIQFSAQNNSDVNLLVQDITGKIIRNEVIKASAGKNLVLMNTADIATGMYFMNVIQGNSKKTIQFIVK